jgi:DNA-binding response OmpR family regulator
VTQRVLVIDDDAALAGVLSDNLVHDGFQVECATDSRAALSRVETFAPDLVLLDLMLPDGIGFEICRTLSTRVRRPPVIILSARGHTDDVVRGLNLGADDYVTKPFDLQELLARIHAVLRRRESSLGPLKMGEVLVDFQRHQAMRQGALLSLSHLEMQVLHYLAERPGRAVSRDQLLQAVWGYRDAPVTRAVDISIARLRRKIEPDPRRPRYIRTLHGDGYCLTPCRIGEQKLGMGGR